MEEPVIKFIPDEASMLELGKQIAQASLEHINLNRVFFLYGQLGAGKTTLARGFLHGLGYENRVKSPTYTLVESYELSACTLFHFDLYRLHDPNELEFIGIQDYFIPNAICLIEWPEHGKGLLPMPDLVCYISVQGNGREVKLIAQSTQGSIILQRLHHDK